MIEMLRIVLFVFVLGTDNASYSLVKHRLKINEKKSKKTLTCMAFYG
jgi:hypothetical protein